MIECITDIGSTCDLINKPLVVIDLHQTVRYLNTTAEKYFSVISETVSGRDYSEVIKVFELSGLTRAELFDPAGKPYVDGTALLFKQNEFKIFLRYKSKALENNHKDKGWIFIFEDITLEEELKQQLKYKRRLEVLGDLSIGVAHDINNALSCIVGCAEILGQELAVDQRKSKLVQTIISSTSEAAEFSRKLLKFSVPPEPIFELVNIHAFLTEMLQILGNNLEGRIVFESKFIEKEVVIYVDRAELEIVLFNITLNLQEVLRTGGLITVETAIVSNLERSLAITGFDLEIRNYLQITLNSEEIDLIASDRVEDEELDIAQKLGVVNEGQSLASAYNIMKHLKGAIQIIADAAGRVSYQIYLPLARENLESKELLEAEATIARVCQEYEESKAVVLLVDDNEMVRLSIRELLQGLSCEVIEAGNGQEGVDIFKANLGKIDLIILDIVMPEKDGQEALLEIRALDSKVEIVMTSGYASQLSQNVLSELGADEYLQKPFNINEIKRIVNNIGRERGGGSGLGLAGIDNPLISGGSSFEGEGKTEVVEILVIENNENIRELMHEILSESGFSVVAYENTEKAKAAIRAGRYFSISIIDIDVSSIEDKELFSLIRNQENNLPHYIIATSSMDVQQLALRALKLGVDDFILKPFSINFLKIRLEVAKKYIDNELTKNSIQSRLKESEERMSLAIAGAGIGMWDWRIFEKEFFASEKCKELFGYVDGSNIGVLDYLNSITVEEDKSIVTQIFSKYLQDPDGMFDIEFRIQHPQKGEIWIMAVAKLFDDAKNGKPKRLIGITMDITEQKHEEHYLREESLRLEEMVVQRTTELLKSNEKLSREIEAREVAERKNFEQQLKLMDADKLASLGILVAGIGHEINNPIQFIMFNLPFMKNAWESALPVLDAYYQDHPEFELRGVPYLLARERIPNMSKDVIDGAERISSIVKELREYSRKSRDEDFNAEDIVEVVLSAKSMFAKFMGRQDSEVEFKAPSEHIILPLNRTRIQQVIINLLQNAYLAIEDTQRKEIGIKLDYAEAGGFIEIEVSDSGIGVKPEDMKHLTDPFYTTRSSDGGTGLGLAMCKKIVYDHGGELKFESEFGVGTRVKVLLPLTRGDSKGSLRL